VKNYRVLNISLAALTTSFCLVLSYFYFIYWTDVIAGFSNYYVAINVVPVTVSLLIGSVSIYVLPYALASTIPKVLISMTPAIFTLAFILVIRLIFQWSAH
jgi:ABC-type spermidine/putrescine transport system permease subunit I